MDISSNGNDKFVGIISMNIIDLIVI